VDHNMQIGRDLLVREKPTESFNLATMVEAFAPLTEWEYWTRDQKRSVLATLVPDIRVADYRIETIGLSPATFSNENIRTDTDSSRRPT
jgi:hypothetical protein